MANLDEKNTPLYRVSEWLCAAQNRFKNMHTAGVDSEGLRAFSKVVDEIADRQQITVGQFGYLFDRTHPQGKYPNYNTKFGYNRRYGEMITCDLNDIIDSDIVNWETGRPATNVKQAIADNTDWHWHNGTLKRKPAKTADVFVSQ